MRLRTALLAAALLLPTPLFAQVTYYYTGQDFFFSTGAPYSTSDSIAGEFTVSAPLTDDLTSLTPISPTSFSFTDGVDTITNLTAGVSDTFQVETGPSGNITAWNISLSIPVTTPDAGSTSIQTEDYPAGNYVEDVATDDQYLSGDLYFFVAQADNGREPGTWGTTPPTSATPEPSSFLLLLTALPALAAASRSQSLKSLSR